MFEFESLILSWYFLLFTMPKLVLFFWIELIFLCLITGDQFFCHLSQNDNMYVSKKNSMYHKKEFCFVNSVYLVIDRWYILACKNAH